MSWQGRDDKGMVNKEAVAKGIRVLSVPPIIVSILVFILARVRSDIFRSVSEVLIIGILLGVVPIIAYPLQKLIPSLKEKGREGQRKLAFIMNLLGYGIALVWAFAVSATKQVKLICLTYFISVLLLTLCNTLLRFRASGHACSFTGPLLLLVYFVGVKTIIPCLLVAALIIWASLSLKRHTAKELLGGISVCVVSFILAHLITFFVL
ncbi:hypothetical protein [Ohessyouella blattaphilus]|nr:hypothetical protein [Ohessyouella blattaphilus]MDL2249730.1 hypothetical protein [Lachnospiraceae bacterium OttesenSCG-928-J05]